MKTSWAVKALPASLLAFMCLAAGCSSTDADNCKLTASIDAVTSAADTLIEASTSMRGKLYVACSNIAGTAKVDAGAVTDAAVQTACNDASAKIKAQVAASAGVQVTYVPGKCEVVAEAQLSCEGKCQADVSCTEPSIDVRCEPGKLSVECSGECSGTLSCEGSASASVKCEGTCNGSCTGSCSGTCNGDCDGTCEVKDSAGKCAGKCTGMCKGSCSASCEGTCSGSCTYNADAMVKCDATARCEGMCTGEAKAPRCDGKIDPPKCMGNASCQASCESKAKFDAKCTPPTVGVTGFADLAFTATLSENLPAVYAVLEQATVAADGAKKLIDATVSFAGDVTSDISCGLAKSGAVATKLEAAIKAQATVNVSVMASVSVSGSASGG